MRKQCMAYKSGFILPKKGVIEAKFQKGLSLSSKFIHYRLTWYYLKPSGVPFIALQLKDYTIFELVKKSFLIDYVISQRKKLQQKQ